MNVHLHAKAMTDKMLLSKRAHHRHPILVGHLVIGRQGDHQLAGHLGVFALLGRLGGVPKRGTFGQCRIRAFGQQHLVALGLITVLEVVELARPLVGDRRPGVVGGGADGNAAGGSADVAGASKSDGHDRLTL